MWSEVKIKYTDGVAEGNEANGKYFDYTFDYVICPTRPKSIAEIAAQQGCTERKLETALSNNGYTLAQRDGDIYLEEFRKACLASPKGS